MNQKPNTPANPATWDSAFEALRHYDSGSARGKLGPLDQVVIDALANSQVCLALEKRFLAALKDNPSSVAAEYICSKLVLVGSETCVPAVAELLGIPALSTVARSALEQIPEGASQALRRAVPKLGRAAKVGAIQSLGARRDAGSVSLLSKCLGDPETAVAAAAAAALGEIGSVPAAKVLRASLRAGPKSLLATATEAALVCAERLLADGNASAAKSVYDSVLASDCPRHVQHAASRGLAGCARSRNQSAGT